MSSIWRGFKPLENCEKKTYLLSILAITAVASFFVLMSLYSEPRYVELYVNVVTVLAAGATFWASLQVLEGQKWILYELLRAPWFYISVGLGLWLIAETVWLTYIVLLGEPLELSIADIAWVLGYVFMFAGLYRGVKPLHLLAKDTGLSRKTKLVYIAPLVLGILLIAETLAEAPRAIAEEGLPAVIMDTSYILLDVVLLTLSLETIVFFYGGKMARGLTLFSIGLALLSISDLPYFAIGGYYPGNPLDLLYIVSYMVIATGIYIYSRQLPVI